jgi:hypothetical protein
MTFHLQKLHQDPGCLTEDGDYTLCSNGGDFLLQEMITAIASMKKRRARLMWRACDKR